MRYFKLPDNRVYGYEDAQINLIEKILKKGAQEVTDSWPPPPQPRTQKQIEDEIKIKTQEKMDITAKEWGYFNFITAISYQNSANRSYSAESRLLTNWRDSVWDYIFSQFTNSLTEADIETIVNNIPSSPAKPMV